MPTRSSLGPHSHQQQQKSHLISPSPRSQQQRDSGSYFPPQSIPDPNAAISRPSFPTPQTVTALMTDSSLPPSSNWRGKFAEEWNVPQRGSSILTENNPSDPINGTTIVNHPPVPSTINGALAPIYSSMNRSSSYAPSVPEEVSISRKNTLKKKSSVRRNASLKRSGSRRSMKAGSVKSLAFQSNSDPDELHNAFFCPVPTSGNPTDLLAQRFQVWRKILKDLITFFREIQNYYDHRAKSLSRLSNSLSSIGTPPGFLSSGGVDDALQILRNYNKQAVMESHKANEIEEDVILALTGLRSDLHLKIKEIKNLSGDFKNSVEKEMDGTRRAVTNLQEVLGQADLDSSLTIGKQDPYLLRLAVDRQLEKQIDEENYLHQAYLNLESSGRELESIVVGEVQKSYNALASILKRDADCAYNTIEELRLGPISMPKDHEWLAFINKDNQFVDPQLPIRSVEYIHYPGRDHYACQELRVGLLERKSKYLKSYTAGWYVLSPTHLHEFKSADKTGAPIMSLYLPEQRLGSHSANGASSNKFILKGRQTGSMHRGHTWVFRAESHDTMMAWYEDIKALTEKTPQERSEFVRSHSRAGSRASARPASVSSDGAMDEEDEEAFGASATDMNVVTAKNQPIQKGVYGNNLPRPNTSGRFPSGDLVISPSRGLQQGPLSPDSVASSNGGHEAHTSPEPTISSNTLPSNILVSRSAHSEFTTEKNKSVKGSSPDRYSKLPATSFPFNAGYDPVTDHHSLGVQSNQHPRTPSPAPPVKNSTVALAASQSDVATGSLPNGTRVNRRFSFTDSDNGNLVKPESPAMAAASAVMGNGKSMTTNGSSGAYDIAGSGLENTSERRKVSKRDSSLRVEMLSRRPDAPRTETGNTISNLHIPGQYPRGLTS